MFSSIKHTLRSVSAAFSVHMPLRLSISSWAADSGILNRAATMEYLSSVYGSLFNIFLSSLYHAMDNLPNLKPSDIEPYLTILEHVRDSGLLERFDVDIGARMKDVQERVQQVAAEFYDLKMQELAAAPGVNRALPLLLMTDEIEKSAKLLDKRFPSPILELVFCSFFVDLC